MGLMIDQREFKRELHRLIDLTEPKVRSNASWVEEFRQDVGELVKKHGITLDVEKYTGHLVRMMMALNMGRAHKLVDVLEDDTPSKGLLMLANLGLQLLRLGGLVLVILAVLWLVGVL